MSSVMIYQRAGRDFAADIAARGHHVVYRAGETNRCPGCGRAQWHIGRITAECGFCATAVPLAEAKWGATGGGDSRAPVSGPADKDLRTALRTMPLTEAIDWAEKRRHERVASEGRKLQLLIDGAPTALAVHDISAGGLKGGNPIGLTPGIDVQVRFEGGILVPARVRWTDGDLAGLAFTAPVVLDLSRRN